MNIDMTQAFPGKYLKADDLQGKEPTVRIDRVEKEKLGDDTKYVVYFIGREDGPGWVLNKTNTAVLIGMYGPHSDDWHDKPVTLYREDNVYYSGKRTPAIRIKQTFAPSPPKNGKADPISSGPAPKAELNDDIPF